MDFIIFLFYIRAVSSTKLFIAIYDHFLINFYISFPTHQHPLPSSRNLLFVAILPLKYETITKKPRCSIAWILWPPWHRALVAHLDAYAPLISKSPTSLPPSSSFSFNLIFFKTKARSAKYYLRKSSSRELDTTAFFLQLTEPWCIPTQPLSFLHVMNILVL